MPRCHAHQQSVSSNNIVIIATVANNYSFSWMNVCCSNRQEIIVLRVWDQHMARHMTRWRRAEQEMWTLAATLVQVSVDQVCLLWVIWINMVCSALYCISHPLFSNFCRGFKISRRKPNRLSARHSDGPWAISLESNTWRNTKKHAQGTCQSLGTKKGAYGVLPEPSTQ